jgi:hypothetical protein
MAKKRDSNDSTKAKEEEAPGKTLPKQNKHNNNEGDQELREQVVPYLLMRAYHLPGYTWRQDLWQYLTNNHPLFGIFCHHKWHPIGATMRALALVGSIMFGMATTNIIYLAFVFTHQNYEKTYLNVTTTTTTGATGYTNFTTSNHFVDDNVPDTLLTLSNGNIALWTVGAALNAFYDNTVWSIAAWSWKNDNTISERIKGYQNVTRTVLVILSVLVAVALATFAFCLRNALENNSSQHGDVMAVRSGGLADDEVQLTVRTIDGNTTNDLEFLLAYAVELALSFFVWYPIVGTLLFTGILGCYKLPVLGGRPYDILWQERVRQQAEEKDDSHNSGPC